MPKDRQRRYTDKEVSAILRLAMESGGPGADIDHEGMSLDELVNVASDAGIEPDLIRSAAEKLDTLEAPSPRFDIVGCRPYTELVRVVDGEVTPENWDEIVAELRSAFSGPTGEASQLGKTSEWHAGSLFTALHVSATPEGGRTNMKVSLTSRDVPVFAYGLTFVFAGLVLFLKVAPELSSGLGISMGFALPATLGAMLGTLGLVRVAVGSWYRNKTRQMKDALDRVQEVVGRERGPSSVAVQTPVEDELRIQIGESD